MKKVYVVFALVVSLFLGIRTASAMTEAKLKEIMEQTFSINGGEFKLTDEAKVLVERYLNAYDVNEADCQYIADRVEEAKSIFHRTFAAEEGKVIDLSKI